MTDKQIEQEIQAKGLTAPRVTPADVEAAIASENYFTAADGICGANIAAGPGIGQIPYTEHTLLTFCVLVLRNGFTVTGESACASPENFDAEIGRKIARQKAIEKVWPLLGFRLRDKLATKPMDYRDRVLNEKAELDAKINALQASTIWGRLGPDEQERLSAQLACMKDYSLILGQRITAWQKPAAN